MDGTVVSETLRAVAPYAEQAGVTLLVETNGVYGNTKRLAELRAPFERQHRRSLGYAPPTASATIPETVQNLGAY